MTALSRIFYIDVVKDVTPAWRIGGVKINNEIKNLSELLLLFSMHPRTVAVRKLQPSDDGWMSPVKLIGGPSLDSTGKVSIQNYLHSWHSFPFHWQFQEHKRIRRLPIRVHQLVDISGKEETNEELRRLCCCFAYLIDKIRDCSLLVFLNHKYVKLVVRSCLEGRILSWEKYREKYKMSSSVTVHPIVMWRTQSEPSQAVHVFTVDDVTFLEL